MNTAAMQDEAIISLQDVYKEFEGNQVLCGLDLDIRAGETMTILGGSGTGKSVVLKIIVGLLKADRGRVVLFGEDTTSLGDADMIHLRRRMGVLFQGSALFDSLTVLDNVAYPLREHGGAGQRDIEGIVKEKLTLVGLENIEHLRPAELSGGMRKRVGLARAIALEPEVILYDEPTTGLDPVNTLRIDTLIKELQERLRVTSVVVTHDIMSALRISDRIAFLSEGKILEVGTPFDMLKSRTPAVREFMNDIYTLLRRRSASGFRGGAGAAESKTGGGV